MIHLEDEDIGRLVEESVSPEEREIFLEHMSHCRRCQTVYSETLKFHMQEEENIIELKPARSKRKFTAWGIRVAAAAIIMAVLLGIIIMIQSPGEGINSETQLFLAQRYERLEKEYMQGFFPYGDRDVTAVRIGIFWEDLSIVVKEQGEKTLKTNIQKLLTGQLKLFIDKTNPLMEAVTDVETGNLKNIESSIRQLMEKESLAELYLFGRFLERSLLATYEKKMPDRIEIIKYQRLAKEYKFSIGVLRGLSMLETAAGIEESRSICNNIVEIFFD
jgi:hypothetical protein